MSSLKFKKVKENFICEKCGFEVLGDGYTNHCPRCLWSKHVDINPGDRAEDCGGMMEPVRVEKDGDGYRIKHKCLRCGKEKWNKMADNDKVEEVVGLQG